MTKRKPGSQIVKVLLICTLMAGVARADVAVMRDGSKIVGQARRLEQGRLTMSTQFAGDIAIDWEQVKTLQTDNPELAHLKPLPQPREEEAEPPRVWTNEIGFDLAGKSGNTDSMRYGLTASTELKTANDKLKLFLSAEQAEVDGEKDVDNATAGVDYERSLTDGSVWYVRSDVHQDEFKDIKYRWTTAGGLGHYFVKEDNHSLQGRLGLRYTRESYEPPEPGSGEEDRGTEDDVGIEMAAAHMIQLSKWIKVVSDLKYLPEFTDTDKYRIHHESAVDIPIAGSSQWKLRLGIANDYQSQPANDSERLDTSYFVRLVLNWENGKFLESSGLIKP